MPAQTLVEVRWAHALRAQLQTVTANANFRACGTQWAREVRVVMAPTGETRRHGYHLCTCVHLCPVCWSRRRITERAEIRHTGELWLAAGGGIELVTLTVPHEAGEPLEAVLDRLDGRAKGLRNGWARSQLRDLGLEHVITALEVTHGANGWHPHQHALWLTREPWGEPTRAGLIRWFRDRWHRRDAGASPSPPPADVRPIERDELEAESGHITKGPSRSTWERYWKAVEDGNLSLAAYLAPFAFGEQAATGDPSACATWGEYERSMHGRNWMRWSNGLRAAMGLGPAGRWVFEGEEIARDPASLRPVQGRDSGRGHDG